MTLGGSLGLGPSLPLWTGSHSWGAHLSLKLVSLIMVSFAYICQVHSIKITATSKPQADFRRN